MRRRKTAIFFLVLGISLSGLAIALNVGWILLNLREVVILVIGIIFFAAIITGLILNTIFLVREIRRSEKHDAFLNAVTHELKTPIASIKLYLETLRSRDVPEEKRAQFYDAMLADSDRLLKTVEQVLEAGRLTEKRREFHITDVDIGGLIAEAAASTIASHKLDENTIKLSLPEKSLYVSGDAEELRTVFTNLLDNAVKYSGDDRRISIRISPTAMGRRVAIVIRDNGIGIPSSELKRIFKRFHRVGGDEHRAKGTGLGLFIVRSIIERHGGRIKADSRGAGHGSTFSIHLPLTEYEDTAN